MRPLLYFLAACFCVQAHAQDGQDPAAGAEAPKAMLIPTRAEKPRLKDKKSKGRRVREKETDGTEAADRFKADTVIESKYRYNNRNLEVDPD